MSEELHAQMLKAILRHIVNAADASFREQKTFISGRRALLIIFVYSKAKPKPTVSGYHGWFLMI